MIVFPAGLFLYGWTAEAQTHWIGPMIGSCILSYGLMLSFNSCQVSPSIHPDLRAPSHG